MNGNSKNPRKQALIKFILLCIVMVGYFSYLSYEYDLLTGGVAALLTWSFFVLCTPIADAGFLVDFPLRLLFGIRMVMSELFVWAVAIFINVTVLAYADRYYETIILTEIFYRILVTPIPYWSVILLSAAGTFMSIRFGDELMDVVHHRDRHFFHSNHFKHELILVVFFCMVLVGYYKLIASMGIDKVIDLP